MKLEWMGAYREIIGDFYRSANGYSQICKNEMFGDPIKFSPYEVQIMEHIMEHADQHRNMKWYANRLGLSQATYSKYVRKLVDKGLLEKYHNKKKKKFYNYRSFKNRKMSMIACAHNVIILAKIFAKFNRGAN